MFAIGSHLEFKFTDYNYTIDMNLELFISYRLRHFVAFPWVQFEPESILRRLTVLLQYIYDNL